MRKVHRSRVHALISLLLVTNASILGQSNRAPRLPCGFKDELEASIKDQITHHGLTSIAISVMQNGQTLYEAGFGFADREARMQATPSLFIA